MHLFANETNSRFFWLFSAKTPPTNVARIERIAIEACVKEILGIDHCNWRVLDQLGFFTWAKRCHIQIHNVCISDASVSYRRSSPTQNGWWQTSEHEKFGSKREQMHKGWKGGRWRENRIREMRSQSNKNGSTSSTCWWTEKSILWTEPAMTVNCPSPPASTQWEAVTIHCRPTLREA